MLLFENKLKKIAFCVYTMSSSKWQLAFDFSDVGALKFVHIRTETYGSILRLNAFPSEHLT